MRSGPERPFKSPEGNRNSGSRSASDARRHRAARSLSRSASPAKPRLDVQSPAPASTLSSVRHTVALMQLDPAVFCLGLVWS